MAKKVKKYGIPILIAMAVPGGIIAAITAVYIYHRHNRRHNRRSATAI